MSSIFKGMLTALLVTDSSIAFQIRWARLLATAYNLDLLILSGEKNQDRRVVEFDLDYPPDPDADESLLEIWNLIETDPEKGFFVVFRFYGPTEGYIDKTWVMDDFELIK